MVSVAVLSFGLSAPVPREARKPRIDYYPTQVGAKRVYKNTQNEDWERVEVVTAVEERGTGKTIRVGTVAKDGKVTHYQTMRLSPEGLFQISMRENAESANCFLRFPITAGDKWTCVCEDGPAEATCEGFEEVEVPAGRFRAVKVTARWQTRNLAGGEATIWFAPGIGPVKTIWGRDDCAVVLHSFSTEKEPAP